MSFKAGGIQVSYFSEFSTYIFFSPLLLKGTRVILTALRVNPKERFLEEITEMIRKQRK